MNERLERMRANPQGKWRIADIEVVCRNAGVSCLAARGGGSHYKLSHPSQKQILTIPYKRPIKPIYIRKLVAFLDAVDAEQ